MRWPWFYWLYVGTGVALFFKMLWLPNPLSPLDTLALVDSIVQDTGVPNTVSGIILRNRLYDTLFEVIVFTIAITGAKFLLSNEPPLGTINQFTDSPSIILARLGATIAALISVELAIRGHLSPGGGFAAGVAGGTAIGLIAVTSSFPAMEAIYQKWGAATWEKISVLIFLLLGALTLMGYELPHGTLGTLISGGWIPILNILVAVKVALGSWAALLIFIRYRGLF